MHLVKAFGVLSLVTLCAGQEDQRTKFNQILKDFGFSASIQENISQRKPDVLSNVIPDSATIHQSPFTRQPPSGGGFGKLTGSQRVRGSSVSQQTRSRLGFPPFKSQPQPQPQRQSQPQPQRQLQPQPQRQSQPQPQRQSQSQPQRRPQPQPQRQSQPQPQRQSHPQPQRQSQPQPQRQSQSQPQSRPQPQPQRQSQPQPLRQPQPQPQRRPQPQPQRQSQTGTERQSLADMAKLFDFAPALEVKGSDGGRQGRPATPQGRGTSRQATPVASQTPRPVVGERRSIPAPAPALPPSTTPFTALRSPSKVFNSARGSRGPASSIATPPTRTEQRGDVLQNLLEIAGAASSNPVRSQPGSNPVRVQPATNPVRAQPSSPALTPQNSRSGEDSSRRFAVRSRARQSVRQSPGTSTRLSPSPAPTPPARPPSPPTRPTPPPPARTSSSPRAFLQLTPDPAALQRIESNRAERTQLPLRSSSSARSTEPEDPVSQLNQIQRQFSSNPPRRTAATQPTLNQRDNQPSRPNSRTELPIRKSAVRKEEEEVPRRGEVRDDVGRDERRDEGPQTSCTNICDILIFEIYQLLGGNGCVC